MMSALGGGAEVPPKEFDSADKLRECDSGNREGF